jgi:PEP-CTERM motif
VGDLYTFLNVSFANNPLSGGNLVYLQDADNASTEIVIRDTPEPASMMGLLGLGAIATISKLKRKH